MHAYFSLFLVSCVTECQRGWDFKCYYDEAYRGQAALWQSRVGRWRRLGFPQVRREGAGRTQHRFFWITLPASPCFYLQASIAEHETRFRGAETGDWAAAVLVRRRDKCGRPDALVLGQALRWTPRGTSTEGAGRTTSRAWQSGLSSRTQSCSFSSFHTFVEAMPLASRSGQARASTAWVCTEGVFPGPWASLSSRVNMNRCGNFEKTRLGSFTDISQESDTPIEYRYLYLSGSRVRSLLLVKAPWPGSLGYMRRYGCSLA